METSNPQTMSRDYSIGQNAQAVNNMQIQVAVLASKLEDLIKSFQDSTKRVEISIAALTVTQTTELASFKTDQIKRTDEINRGVTDWNRALRMLEVSQQNVNSRLEAQDKEVNYLKNEIIKKMQEKQGQQEYNLNIFSDKIDKIANLIELKDKDNNIVKTVVFKTIEVILIAVLVGGLSLVITNIQK